MTFGVLGPLEVRAADGLVHVGGPQIRALLALLLVRPGHVISLSTLVASLWSGDAPPSAERTARTYMSRLRLALAPLTGRTPAGPLIVTAPPGYLLRADPMSVDASLFEQLALAGRRALTGNDPEAARSYLRSALRLWRGDAYAEFADVPVLRAEASRLEELRLSAVETRLQSELAMGLGPDLVAELDSLVTAHPLRERLWVQYMTALYRSGRQAEALSAYQRARALLADELGLEPSVELADTHRRILAQDPKLLPELATAALAAPAVLLAAARPAGPGSDLAREWAGSSQHPLRAGWTGRPQRELQPEWMARQDLHAEWTPQPDLEPEWTPQPDLEPEWTPQHDLEPEWTPQHDPPQHDPPQHDPPAAEPESAADRVLNSQPIRNWFAPKEGRPGSTPADWQRVPGWMRSALGMIAGVLARPLVRTLVSRVGRILVLLGRGAAWLASAVPVRVRAWWRWGTVGSCRGLFQRPQGE
ncbi:MAG TPA: BTAD domain-containing putative transcriptional regulator [Jatrophihabitans sp.]